MRGAQEVLSEQYNTERSFLVLSGNDASLTQSDLRNNRQIFSHSKLQNVVCFKFRVIVPEDTLSSRDTDSIGCQETKQTFTH